MSHAIYETRALIMHRAAVREGDALVELFTEELGYVRAIASGVRLERSKMRYALEPYALSSVTLLRGRDSWRVRGAESVGGVYRDLAARGDRELMVRVTALLRRLLAGEEGHAELFSEVTKGFSLLVSGRIATDEKAAYESLLVLRILSLLGYRPEHPELIDFLPPQALSEVAVKTFLPVTRRAVAFINTALQESGL